MVKMGRKQEESNDYEADNAAEWELDSIPDESKKSLPSSPAGQRKTAVSNANYPVVQAAGSGSNMVDAHMLIDAGDSTTARYGRESVIPRELATPNGHSSMINSQPQKSGPQSNAVRASIPRGNPANAIQGNSALARPSGEPINSRSQANGATTSARGRGLAKPNGRTIVLPLPQTQSTSSRSTASTMQQNGGTRMRNAQAPSSGSRPIASATQQNGGTWMGNVKCKFNPCLNPSCAFKHVEGQKRGKFGDQVSVNAQAHSTGSRPVARTMQQNGGPLMRNAQAQGTGSRPIASTMQQNGGTRMGNAQAQSTGSQPITSTMQQNGGPLMRNAQAQSIGSRPIASTTQQNGGPLMFNVRVSENHQWGPYRGLASINLAGYGDRTDGTKKLTGKDKFAKVPRVQSQRVRDAMVQRKEAKALDQRYLGQPRPDELFDVHGYYRLDDLNGLIMFGDNLEELNIVRLQCKVFIDFDVVTKCLRVRCKYEEEINGVFKAIQLRIRELETATCGSAPKYIVHPANAEEHKELVVATSFRTDNLFGGTQIINHLEMVGRSLTEVEKKKYENVRINQISENLKAYAQHLKERMGQLRYHKSSMEMVVHFGHEELIAYSKNLAGTGLSYDEFRKMMTMKRTRGSFEDKMDVALADRIIGLVLGAPYDFCTPSTSIVGTLAEVEPRYTFIVFVKSPSNESTRLEITLEKNDGAYHLTAAASYRDLRHKKRLDVTTLVLGERFDVRHEVIVNTLVKDIEPNMWTLIRKFESGLLTTKADQKGVEIPRISFLKDHFRPGVGHEMLDGGLIVENVVLKGSWAYALVGGTKYQMEVDVYRNWKGHKTNVEPFEMKCGVNFYHPDWHDLMEEVPDVGGEHKWHPQLKEFFPDADGMDGFEFFLEKIGVVRKLLNEAFLNGA